MNIEQEANSIIGEMDFKIDSHEAKMLLYIAFQMQFADTLSHKTSLDEKELKICVKVLQAMSSAIYDELVSHCKKGDSVMRSSFLIAIKKVYLSTQQGIP